jgi:hypothetical protein
MLAAVLLLILSGALAVVAFSIGLVWLLLDERGEDRGRAGQPLSLTQSFARELDGRQVWRALSAWMTAKPPRIEDRRDTDAG